MDDFDVEGSTAVAIQAMTNEDESPESLPLFESKYQATAELGRGGMGVVYIGTDTFLNRPVAIKVMAPEVSADPMVCKRFLREARTLATLDHPNIVSIYSYGTQDGLTYFVMKYLEGVPLNTHPDLQKGAASELIPKLKPVFEALKHAHDRGIIHRDLKPGNILFTKQGIPVLLDFGISKDSNLSRVTTAGTVLGTPTYMSPEQAIGVDELTPATDQYSMAVILYELLTGELPFYSEQPMVLLFKHVQEQPPPLREKNPDVPEAVEKIVLQAMSKQPQERFADCMAFYDALEQALTGASPQQPAPQAAGPAAPRAASPVPITAGQPQQTWGAPQGAPAGWSPLPGDNGAQSTLPTLAQQGYAPGPLPGGQQGMVQPSVPGQAAAPGMTSGPVPQGYAPPVGATQPAPAKKGSKAILLALVMLVLVGAPAAAVLYVRFASKGEAPDPEKGTAATAVAAGEKTGDEGGDDFEPTTVTLVLSSKPDGAEVRCGDELLGKTPLIKAVKVTSPELILTKEGYRPHTLSVAGKKELTESVKLVPTEKAPAAETAEKDEPEAAPKSPRRKKRTRRFSLGN